LLSTRRARHAAETGDSRATTAEIDHLEDLGRSGVDAARRLISHLAPAELDDRTLPAALASLSAQDARPGPPVVEVRVDGDVHRLPGDVEGALLRVAQEAVANARRHAHAERVVITLTYQPSTVSLDIVDDGVGFDPATAGPRGFGLGGMRSRVEQLGGTFHVDSEPGRGSTVNATIGAAPIEQGPCG
jgi:signal transduction histidine kinase